LLIYNPRTQEFSDERMGSLDDESAVGCISFPNCPGATGCPFVVYGTEAGKVCSYEIKSKDKGGAAKEYGDLLPGGGVGRAPIELNAGPIVALAMDTVNTEGLVGCGDGSIFYINFKDADSADGGKIPLVRKMTSSMERIA
jgi:hypothetical protein